MPPVELDQLAARALARGSRGSSHRSDPVAVDPRTVEVVAAAIRARKRSRRLRWTGAAGALAVAAAVVLAIGVVSRHRPGPVAAAPLTAPSTPVVATAATVTGMVDSVVGDAEVVRRDGRRSVAGGSPITAGDELVVPRGARLGFLLSTGTRIALEEGSDVAVVEEGSTQLFRLAAGSMRAQVHELEPGDRFLVRTADAEVEVRGTSLRVSVDPSGDPCGGGVATRVQVDEGVVTVRAGSEVTRVAAGETWPAGCSAATTPGAAATSVAASPSLPTQTPTQTVSAARARATERSQLAEQNDLYARAVTSREAGDNSGALALFERLAARYPSSPLAENAAAERMKLLASTRRPDAGQAAADYLARYPAGFARKDAEEIVARERRQH